jgi:hypothetical protein
MPEEEAQPSRPSTEMSDLSAESRHPSDPKGHPLIETDRATLLARGGARVLGWGRLPATEVLRIGTGLIWLTNLIYIADPANRYWASFSATARSFAPTTIGGPGLAEYVSAHPFVFSWAIALITGYLAVAFLLGFTTRAACLVGGGFSGVLLATQVGSTFFFPGGTDVGAHPLYLLIYAALVLGGAGASVSLDSVLAPELHRLRSRWSRPERRPHVAWTASLPPQTLFAYFAVGIMLSFGIALGLEVAIPVSHQGGAAGPVPVRYANLTVGINPVNGWPQFSPANFTVPAGEVVVTITDRDMPMNWSGCQCQVRGTLGGVEWVNGTLLGYVPPTNVAHTFTIPSLGLEILSPGDSIVRFTVDILGPGNYTWFCLAPCGTGTDPYSTPPMGIPGYMTGTMTVTL